MRINNDDTEYKPKYFSNKKTGNKKMNNLIKVEVLVMDNITSFAMQ